MPSRTFSAVFAIAVVFAAQTVAVAQNGTGTISGRIETANGMSAVAVRVAALSVERNLATDGSIVPMTTAESDGVGRFRLDDIPPGRYYIVAGPLQTQTYYPGAIDIVGAKPVSIEPGTVLDAVNFQLQRSGGVRVRGGLIRNADWHDERKLTMRNLLTGETFGQTDISPDGSFEFVGVPPGTYSLISPNQFDRMIWSSKPLVIGDRDVTNIGLTTGPYVLASGRASVEGGGPLHDVWLSFKGPSGWSYTSIGYENRRDGTLRFALPVGEYQVELGGLPNAYKLESLRYGKSNLLQETLKVVGVVQPLFIALKTSRTAAFVRVSGRIVGIENLPEEYVTPNVVLEVQKYYSPLLEVSVGFDGHFEFPRVLPGNYYISGPGLPRSPLVVGSGGVSNFEFVIPEYRRVAGRVVVEGGLPLPASFDLSLTSNMSNGQTADHYLRRNLDGTFDGMIPEGNHRLHVYITNRYAMASIAWGSTNLLREPLRIAGRDATDILVTLRFIPQPTVRVSGRVFGLGTPQDGTARTVTLSAFPIQVDAPIGPDGSFEFAKVEKGSYNASSGSTVFKKITVENQDIDGIELRPVSQFNDVAIEVVTEDGSPKPNLSLKFTRLQGVPAVEPNDLFAGDAWLSEGEFRVEVRDMPDANYQLKSLTYGSVNLLKETLKLTGPNTRVRIIATVARKPGTTWAKVSGRVLGMENLKALDLSQVVLSGPAMELQVPVAPGGRFDFPAVLPGIYSLNINQYVVAIPPTTVVVANDDVRDVQLRVPREQMVAGRVVIGDGYAMPPARLRVWINAASGQPTPPHGGMVVQTGDPTIDTGLDIGPDGSFKIVLPEGDHRIEIGGLPAKFYEVKSLAYGAADLLKGPLKISGSDSREIVVNLGTRQAEPWPKVSGRVHGVSNLPTPLKVVLQGTRLAFQAMTNSDGSFNFHRIPPGTYVAGTDPTVSSMMHPTAIARGDETLLELTIPERRQVKVRAIVEGNGRVPNFSLTVRLNGIEGYQVSANPLSSGTFVYIRPLGFVCVGDVCTTAMPGRYRNEPSVAPNSSDAQSFGLMLPVGEHPVTIDVYPAGYEVKSASYGASNLLKEPLRILEDGGEILLTFKPK